MSCVYSSCCSPAKACIISDPSSLLLELNEIVSSCCYGVSLDEFFLNDVYAILLVVLLCICHHWRGCRGVDIDVIGKVGI